MKASRIAAIGLVAAATLWMGSGHLFPPEPEQSKAAIRTNDTETKKPFRVAVTEVSVVPHARKLVLSGRTEADRKVMVAARGGGVITELKVRRGSRVKKDDVIAVLSDEAREAQVLQARALYTQRKTELDAKRRLIDTGALPRLELVNLEAQFKAAEAALAAAEAERDRGVVRAPWDGLITEVPVEVGQAAFSFSGREIAQLITLDPMLAVVEVAERKLGGIHVGGTAEIRLVTGQTATGRIRFVASMASPQTRTYRVEVEVPNAAGTIPDGITAEVALPMTAEPAARVPRSALTFSSAGDLGVRTVRDNGRVAFVPVGIVEDEQSHMWVSGLADGAQLITQGQDFVSEGQIVEAVSAGASASATN
jgi:membrane fusion protein, multidrug efflux system